MSDSSAQDDNVTYRLLERVTNLLICSRCFRRNVRRPVKMVLSRQHKPMPVCAECSGESRASGPAKVLQLDPAQSDRASSR